PSRRRSRARRSDGRPAAGAGSGRPAGASAAPRWPTSGCGARTPPARSARPPRPRRSGRDSRTLSVDSWPRIVGSQRCGSNGRRAVAGHVAGAVGRRGAGGGARGWGVAGRWVGAVASGARLAAVVKVGDGDDTGLRREHEMLVAVARRRLGLAVPPVLWAGEVAGRYVLVTGPLRRRAAPVLDVATAADTATRLTAPPDGGEPPVHGGLTSWNLWRDGDGPVLIDWESAATGRRPLWDLAWFVVTAGALRGAWGPRAAVEALTAPGSPGVVHLRAVGADAASAGRRLREVLEGAGASQRDDRLDRYVTAMRRELARR